MRMPGTTLPSTLLHIIILVIVFSGTCCAKGVLDSNSVAVDPSNEQDSNMVAADPSDEDGDSVPGSNPPLMAKGINSSSSNNEEDSILKTGKWLQCWANQGPNIPSWCCTDNNSWRCSWFNGHCVRYIDSGSCDFTRSRCHYDGCVCCGSCDGPNHINSCKSNQGTCRTVCEKDEYFDGTLTCSSRECRCCKKFCNGESTCAGGTGRCMHKVKRCPRGYYASADHLCSGHDCKCCVPCNSSCDCSKLEGFCEGWEKKCPLGFRDEKCHCSQRECRCCSRRCTRRTYNYFARAERDYYDDEMMGQEAMAQEVEDMENEEM